jgi:hypothetical protein
MLDEDVISQKLALLATHRRTLAALLQQQALLGGAAYAPPGVINAIEEARASISDIKATLRERGIPVEDDLNDKAPSQAGPTQSEDDYAEGNTGASQARSLQLIVAAFTGVVTGIITVSSGVGIYNILDVSFKSYFWLLWPLTLVFAGLFVGVFISSKGNKQEPELVLTQERKEEIRILGVPVWSVVHYEKGRRDWCLFGIPIWSFAINHVAIPIVTISGITTGLLAGSVILFTYSANNPPSEVSQIPEPSPTLTSISTSTSFPTPSVQLPTLTMTIIPSSTPTEEPVPTKLPSPPTLLTTPDSTSPPVTPTPSLPTSIPTLFVPTALPFETTLSPIFKPTPLPQVAKSSPTATITDVITYTVNITQISLDEFRALPGCHDIGTSIVGNRSNNSCIVGPDGLNMRIVDTKGTFWSFPSGARQVYLNWGDDVHIEVVSDVATNKITTIGNNRITAMQDIYYKIEVSKVTSP